MSNEMIIVWLVALTMFIVIFYIIAKKAANENVDMVDKNNRYFVDKLADVNSDLGLIFKQLKIVDKTINDLDKRLKELAK